jgi:hypothetical protein
VASLNSNSNVMEYVAKRLDEIQETQRLQGNQIHAINVSMEGLRVKYGFIGTLSTAVSALVAGVISMLGATK